MTNEELYKKAVEAANELMCDVSVTPHETRRQLTALRDEVDVMLDALNSDIRGLERRQ